MKETQVRRALRFMREHGSITSLDAFETFGCTRLAAVIYTIRHDWNIDVDMEMVNVKNRFGGTCRVARYSIAA